MLEPDDRALLNQLEMQAKRQEHKGITCCWLSNDLSLSGLPVLYLSHTGDGSLPPKRRHSYLNWKRERLQRAVELSKKDLQLAKIRTVGPYFKH